MPLTPQAETEFRNALRALRARHHGPVVPGGAGRTLEAWVLITLADAAHQSGQWRVSLRRGDGTPLPAGAAFNLPNAQSAIRPANHAGPGYVLIERIQAPNIRFELHMGLTWRGRSGATHECDVSMLPASVAEAIRRANGGSPRGLPVVVIECKDKTGIGGLDETRQTLACMYDLVLITQPDPGLPCRIYEDITPQPARRTRWGRRASRYITAYGRGTFGIVRATTFQQGAT